MQINGHHFDYLFPSAGTHPGKEENSNCRTEAAPAAAIIGKQFQQFATATTAGPISGTSIAATATTRSTTAAIGGRKWSAGIVRQ